MSELKTIEDDETGLRLDRWFKRHYPEITHGQLQKLLRTGQVRVDGKRSEAGARLSAGARVRVPPQAEKATKDVSIGKSAHDANDLRKLILYQDDDVIVLNKPAGLAVQGGTGLKKNLDDMLSALAVGSEKPKLVHRLDRETSGALLVARNVYAAAKLAESFRHRDTQKIYWGVTLGVPAPDRGKIDADLVKRGEIMTVAEKGDEDAKAASSLYQIVEHAEKKAAFVALMPVTGRTHQLRVHMACIGTPLLGDKLYAKEKKTSLPLEELGKGLHLHARRLVIPHPRKGIVDVTAPLNPEMRKTWKWFGFSEKAELEFS